MSVALTYVLNAEALSWTSDRCNRICSEDAKIINSANNEICQLHRIVLPEFIDVRSPTDHHFCCVCTCETLRGSVLHSVCLWSVRSGRNIPLNESSGETGLH